MTNTQKEKAEKDDSETVEIKLQFPYVVRHGMSIAQQLIQIYNTTVHKNKNNNVALNVAKLLVL